jgi:GDP-4-dehydro-6-deoxy-D-mannose reductase
MSKVLVTGAAGFIGRHLVPGLAADGHEIVKAERGSGDTADQATWKRFPPADVVVHLAAKSFVPESWDAPGLFVRTNLLGTVEALEYCRVHGARLVFPSSYLYGDVVRQPIPESAKLAAKNPYALSKKLAEEACEFYADRFSVETTILRPFNIYGPGQSDTFLIPTILNQLKAGKEIHVKDLEPRRDYVYIVDVIEAMVKAVGRAGGFGVFNVGSGTSHSVSELIQTIQDVWGTDLPVRSDEVRRQGEIMDTVADIARAQQQLGWTPRFTLRKGLEALHAAP